METKAQQPPQEQQPQTIKMRGVPLTLYSMVLKALGRLPHDDVSDVILELHQAPIFEAHQGTKPKD